MQDYSIPVTVRQNQNNPNQSFYRKNRLAVWAIVVSLVVIGTIVAIIFHKPASVPAPKVTIAIQAPAQVSTANDTVYQLTVTNSDTASIKGVSIDVLYPTGFTFESSSPAASNSDGTNFTNIMQLDPGQNAVIVVKGKTIGNNGEVEQINAVMHYQFSNFNSDFIAQAQAESQIGDSGVALQISGPPQTSTGQASTYTFGYTSTTSQAADGLVMKVTLPAGFTSATYTPNTTTAPDQNSGTAVWNLPTLPGLGSGSVQVAGTFAGLPTGTQENFTVELDGTNVGGANSGQSLVLASTTYQVTIATNPISATVTLGSSGSTASVPTSVDPGAQLQYQVAYQNSGQVAATGVGITVTLAGDAFDLTTLQAQGANIVGNTITWDGSQVQQLASLGPNAAGTLNFSIGVKNPATKGNVHDMTITATPAIKSDQFQQPFTSTPLSLKINTVLTLDETAAVNSGPNPPALGAQTSYMVVLGLRNSTSNVTGVQVTATLPQAYNFDPTLVTFQEQKNVTYSVSTRRLTWNVGAVPAHTGDYSPIRKLTLMVTVLPDQSNVSQTMSLLKSVQVVGTDAFTTNKISFSGTDLTTQSDPGGNGTVVAQ